MASFPKWAAQRLFRLVRSGVGLVSTLATVALFVTPAFASWLSRWWALFPITAYLVYALLHDEYERLKQPCLTAQVRPPKEEGKLGSYSHLEIRNCGNMPIYQVEWELSDDKWQVLTDTIEYPVGELEPGNSKFIPLSPRAGLAALAR